MGHKLVSCTSSPILMHDSLRETFSLYVSLYSILEPLWDPKRNFTSTFGLLSRYKSQRVLWVIPLLCHLAQVSSIRFLFEFPLILQFVHTIWCLETGSTIQLCDSYCLQNLIEFKSCFLVWFWWISEIDLKNWGSCDWIRFYSNLIKFFFCRKWDKPRDAGYYNEWFQVIILQTPTASLFSYLLLCLFGIVSFVKWGIPTYLSGCSSHWVWFCFFLKQRRSKFTFFFYSKIAQVLGFFFPLDRVLKLDEQRGCTSHG